MSHVDEGLLHAYLDGELTPVERARVDEHLAGCAACRTRLDEERALIERASQLLGLATPADRPIPSLTTLARPRRFWHVRMPLAWAATVVLAIGLGWKLAEQLGTLRSMETLGGPIAVRADQSAPVQSPAAPAPPSTKRLDRRRDQAPAAKQTQPPAVANNAPLQDTRAEEKSGAGVAAAMPEPSAPVARSLAPRALMERDALGRVALDSAGARAILGREPLVIPGLAVRRITRSPRASDEVQVEQALDATKVIVLWERPVEPVRSDVPANATQTGATVAKAAPDYVGVGRLIAGVWVQITGAVSVDSLRTLVGKISATPPAAPPH